MNIFTTLPLPHRVWQLVKSEPNRFLSLAYLRGPFIPLFSNQTSPLTAPTSIHKASPQNSQTFKKYQMLHCFFFPEFSRTPKKLHSKLLSRLSEVGLRFGACVEILSCRPRFWKIFLSQEFVRSLFTLWPQTFCT